MLEKELVTGEGFLKKPINLIDRESVWKRIQKAGLTEAEVGYLWMDDSLGLVLDKLDSLGIADNTIVVFASDHGSEKKGSLIKTRGTVPCLIRQLRCTLLGFSKPWTFQNNQISALSLSCQCQDTPGLSHGWQKSLVPMLEDPSRFTEFIYARTRYQHPK